MGAETSDGCAVTLDEGPVRGEKLDNLESLPAEGARCADGCNQAGGSQSHDSHRTATKHSYRSAGESHDRISERDGGNPEASGEVVVKHRACKNVPSGNPTGTTRHAKTCQGIEGRATRFVVTNCSGTTAGRVHNGR